MCRSVIIDFGKRRESINTRTEIKKQFLYLPQTHQRLPQTHFYFPKLPYTTTMPTPTEPHPNPIALTAPKNTSKVDYTPHPSNCIPVSAAQQAIVDAICRLYSGSASKDDMQVYAENAVYDDPWSYCDDRFKVAGQWYGGLAALPHISLSKFGRVEGSLTKGGH
jgi:hypothetical protein